MPVYEYFCPDCEIVFDALRPMAKADEPITCPECTCKGGRRQLSRFAAVSKGTGGETHSVAGAGGCSGCHSSSCVGCSHH